MPTKISSDVATTSAKVFSGLPFPVGGLMLSAAIYDKEIGMLGAAGGLALLVAYAWIAWRFVWSMVDEVTDHGDYLLAKRGSVEDKIFLSDIKDLIDRPYGRPPKAIVKLRAKSVFGWSIAFALTTDKNADGDKGVAADLRHRVRLATAALP
jgi:hypothetical protein